MVAAPAVEQALEIDHAGYALSVFAIPLLLAALLEAPLALFADRVGRRRVLVGSLLGLAAALLLTALATRTWTLSLGLSLAGAASGVACATAQGELIGAFEGNTERAMSRWSAFGALGDVLTPLLVMGLFAIGASYRTALVAGAILVALHALLLARQPEAAKRDDTSGEEEDAPPPLRVALRTALQRPRLFVSLFAATMCGLLDEIVVALLALRLHRDLGVDEATAAGAVSVFSIGLLLGSIATDVVVRRVAARHLLLGSALATVGALGATLASSSLATTMLAAFVLGVTAAPHHPLAQAAAYDAMPGMPGVVNAVAQPFVVLDIVLPMIIGLIAARWGIGAALATLVAQPLVILAVYIRRPPADPGARPSG